MATVLVVSGEQSVRDQLHAILSGQGHEVLLAQSGGEGLALFLQRKPRFTLLDFHPSGMDGIRVLEQIRMTDPFATVIMLDGGVPSALRLHAWRLGAVDFTKKNLPLAALTNTLRRTLQRSARVTDAPQGSLTTAAPSPVQPGPEVIMIVDDEPSICEMITAHFTQIGYRVLVAKNGLEALAWVKQEAPKLMIIDINMPIMDGLSLVRELRARGYAGGILGLTGILEERNLQEMLDLGALDVITKPQSMERLELAVHLGCMLAS